MQAFYSIRIQIELENLMLCAFTPLADTVEKQNKTFIVFKKGANLLLF